MSVLLIAILGCAWLQSMLKLSLMPRLAGIALTLAAAGALFMLYPAMTRQSLPAVRSWFEDAETLRTFCAVAVAQELLTLIVGLRLLERLELGGRKPWYLYLSLLPSLLLVPGGMGMLLFAFFQFIDRPFGLVAGIAIPAAAIATLAGAELLRLARPDRIDRFMGAMGVGYAMTVLAVFLPLAVSAGFSGNAGAPTAAMIENLKIWGLLAVPAAGGAVIMPLVKKIRKKNRHVLCQ